MRNSVVLLLLLATRLLAAQEPPALEPCAVRGLTGDVVCGSVRVPEDRTEPNGRQLTIAVAIARATGPVQALDPFVHLVAEFVATASTAGLDVGCADSSSAPPFLMPRPAVQTPTHALQGTGGDAQGPANPAVYYNSTWSPDGKVLLFESTRDGKSAIYTVRVDGTRLTRLTSDSAENAEARWSPDGKRIVFTSDRDGQHELYLMNRDGSGQTRLTRSTKATLYGAGFSPDGRYVVFQGDLGEGGADLQVWIIRSDGTGLRRLTDPALNSRSPAWPAGGDWITFIQRPSAGKVWNDITPAARSHADSAVRFMAIHPDGSGLREWPHADLRFLIARWSPDGKTLYVVSPLAGPKSVYAMKADGSALRRVADFAAMPGTTVSPDGRYFTYTRNAASGGGVYVYDSRTAQERLVIGGNAGAPQPVVPKPVRPFRT